MLFFYPQSYLTLTQKEFGADLRALCISLYFDYRVTENKIAELLSDHGIYISEGAISNILTGEKADELSKEKESILKAGLKSINYQHIDDTGFRVNGVNK